MSKSFSEDKSGVDKLVYRFATSHDIDQLVELRVLMQTEVNGLPEHQIPSGYKEKVRHYFQGAIESKKYYGAIAVADSVIVGTAGVCLYEKPPSVSGGSGLVGYVTNVYTSKSFRGRGVGTSLMKKLNELAKDLNVDRFHLGATVAGESIYKAVGYYEPRFVNLEIKSPFSKI